MKNSKRFLALLLVMVMVLTLPVYALADDTDGDDGSPVENVSNGKGHGRQKPAKALKPLIKARKDEVEAAKDQLEQEIDELEALFEAAEESGDAELAEQLRQQLQEKKTLHLNYKVQMKELIGQMQLTMRSKYTEEEIDRIRTIAEELGQDPELFVLPVENVISRKANLKFDTPPVIKGNRMLIPVRAIVEGFGAEVTWDQDTQTVTIVKDDKEIVITLGNYTVSVNGEEQEIDVPAQLLCNRTYVPLRFLIQNFGLNIKWDDDTHTVDIDDGQDEPDDEEDLEEEEEEDPTDEEELDEEPTDEDGTDGDETAD